MLGVIAGKLKPRFATRADLSRRRLRERVEMEVVRLRRGTGLTDISFGVKIQDYIQDVRSRFMGTYLWQHITFQHLDS